MGIFQKLKSKILKTSSKISDGLASVLTTKKLDKETLEDIHDLLIMSDMGSNVADKIINDLSKEKFDKDISLQEVKEFLSKKIQEILSGLQQEIRCEEVPNVIVVCGVNGNGKTTTIGKLAALYHRSNKKVMLCACDTFRAAAVEQLSSWADKTESQFIADLDSKDPASIAYRACQSAKDNGVDLLFIDTAGRLQNKKNLMLELGKIDRVIKKVIPSAPHNTILILDATTGMNAINQVEAFNEVMNISGLIITKLDGTAKAGVLIAIAEKFNIPIHFIGVGEQIEDLRPFNAEDFTKALLSID